MKDVFAKIYELLKPVYGTDLANHLYGLNPNGSGDFDAPSGYLICGLAMLVLSVFVMVIYYYVICNKTAHYNRWWHWLIALFLNAGLNFGFGFYIPFADMNAGLVEKGLVVGMNAEAFLLFGFVNAIYASFFFFLFSMLFKRWSISGSTTPFMFRQLISKKH